MGAVFALFSGWYFWIPKILGLDYNLLYSKAHFWVLFAGVNLTFFPQHFLGLQGMPRRISDYPDAFTGWNFISSIGSVISVAATALFLQIVYLQLVKGKAIYGYIWAIPQLFSDYLRILKDRTAPGLEWALHNPPKPHAFTSLPLQSMDPAGMAAEAAKQAVIAVCEHPQHLIGWITITAQEVTNNLIPLCDFNPTTSGIRHAAGNAAGDTFANCAGCNAIMCADCRASYLWLVLPNFWHHLLHLARVGITVISKICYNIKNIFILVSAALVLCLYFSRVINCDAPRAWGLYFQDSASPQMEALVELHNNIMYYLVAILLAVGWIQGAIIRNFQSSKSPISNKYLNHGTLIELIWTITPALILVLIAFPSFKLLYLMDEVTDPALTILAEGHQWYWSYQYPDFLNSDGDFIEFDSYLVPSSDLEKGGLRMLEVDNRVIVPEITHTRFILTAADVIHSFAIPALGIKCDAYPGRLNQFSVLINREGTYYGQCSEICGVHHSGMPITVQALKLKDYLVWLLDQHKGLILFSIATFNKDLPKPYGLPR